MRTLARRSRLVLGADTPFFPNIRKSEEFRKQAEGPRKELDFLRPKPKGEPYSPQMRPGYQGPSYPSSSESPWFDVARMWATVEQFKDAPLYARKSFPVVALTAPMEEQEHAIGEIAQFFGVPMSTFQGMDTNQAWARVIGPLFAEFEQIMMRGRPNHVPGYLHFTLSPQNELLVVYSPR